MTINEDLESIVDTLIVRYKDALSTMERKGVQVRFMREELSELSAKYAQLKTPPMPVFGGPIEVSINSTETMMDIELSPYAYPEVEIEESGYSDNIVSDNELIETGEERVEIYDNKSNTGTRRKRTKSS